MTTPAPTFPFSMFDPVHLGIDENGEHVYVNLAERNMLLGGEPDGLDRPHALPASQLFNRHRLIPRRMLRVLCSVCGHRHLPPLGPPPVNHLPSA